MAKVVHIRNGVTLQIEDKAFASGGEGELYRIISPANYSDQVVKIYKPEKRTKEREQKIEYLVANPPVASNQDTHKSIIWVSDILYERNRFVGFLMPLAKGEKLELLCHPKRPPRLGSEWSKFDFASPEGIKLRQKICFNIAVAMYHVHRMEKYVLVDMKPENIMIQSNGLISIIDIDSVAVTDNKKVLYPGPVVTPDYTPPEYYHGTKGKDIIDEAWDRFSLSVIFYRLLCGIHPFTGSCHPPYDRYNGIAEMIEHGLFPNGNNSKHFKVIPPPHDTFKKLEPNIREMFTRCFGEGHTNPQERPSADEWCMALMPPEMRVLSRPLPSAKFGFPAYQFAKLLAFDPDTKLAFPDIAFIAPKKNVLGNIISNFLGKTGKQKLGDKLAQQELQIRKKLAQQAVFEKELASIIAAFRQAQAAILLAEKSDVAQLKDKFTAAMQRLDKQAKDLCEQEVSEIKMATDAINSRNAEIDKQIRQLYYDMVESRTLRFQNDKARIQADIKALTDKADAESRHLMTAPNKLSKYRIDKNAPDIFNSSDPAKIDNLSLHGFLTAADFVDVDAGGRLKNRSYKWVKVPGIAKVRGAQLNDWRKNLEIKENMAIMDTVKSAYSSRIDSLHLQLRSAESEYQQAIPVFQREYNHEKEKLDAQKKQVYQTYKQQLGEIDTKYNQAHAGFFNEAKDTTAFYEAEVISLSKNMVSELNRNLEKHRALFAKKMEQVNNYLAALQIEVDAMQVLQREYRAMK